VIRAGKPVSVWMTLAPGWRRRDDLSWRATSWDLRRMVTGGLVTEEVADADRAALHVAAEDLALRVKYVGQFGEHAAGKNAGFLQGDVFVEVAGDHARRSESELIASLAGRTKPGDKVAVTVLRGGKKVELTLPMQ